jgi:hypothetical protein
MKLDAFFTAVESHPSLRGVSIESDADDGQLAVEHTDSKLVTVLPVGAIEKADWPLLEEILIGRREPSVLYHMTRVVGYYSRVENWNQSKLGELADRHRGEYAVTG